jgi:2-C-methyl-D-erythritol 2,4-cyclodiphosphate synthase
MAGHAKNFRKTAGEKPCPGHSFKMLRVGFGYDVHPLVPGRPLGLGGVTIPYERGLEGHSDADVLLHALTDAVLGALGAGDIGAHFPNTDPKWKNVASTLFLAESARLAKEKKATILNVDATLLAEAPKLLPHFPAMCAKIAAALGLPVDRVNMKATTNEKLGFIGRGDGIAALAVAALDIP